MLGVPHPHPCFAFAWADPVSVSLRDVAFPAILRSGCFVDLCFWRRKLTISPPHRFRRFWLSRANSGGVAVIFWHGLRAVLAECFGCAWGVVELVVKCPTVLSVAGSSGRKREPWSWWFDSVYRVSACHGFGCLTIQRAVLCQLCHIDRPG